MRQGQLIGPNLGMVTYWVAGSIDVVDLTPATTTTGRLKGQSCSEAATEDLKGQRQLA